MDVINHDIYRQHPPYPMEDPWGTLLGGVAGVLNNSYCGGFHRDRTPANSFLGFSGVPPLFGPKTSCGSQPAIDTELMLRWDKKKYFLVHEKKFFYRTAHAPMLVRTKNYFFL